MGKTGLLHTYDPQVLKLQRLNNYINTFLLKKDHNSKQIISLTIWPAFCNPVIVVPPPVYVSLDKLIGG